jgi:hypothetical protein
LVRKFADDAQRERFSLGLGKRVERRFEEFMHPQMLIARNAGGDVVASTTRCTTAERQAELSANCAMSIGDPPSDSSFQARGQAVILYLPKYCILDKKVLALDRAPATQQ